ncbi:hypothetical protein MUB23_00315 [Cuneatibacter sp. NSJ-177]|nr:hypothetical protein [Cuneatibacter sp. NSJ-177]
MKKKQTTIKSLHPGMNRDAQAWFSQSMDTAAEKRRPEMRWNLKYPA